LENMVENGMKLFLIFFFFILLKFKFIVFLGYTKFKLQYFIIILTMILVTILMPLQIREMPQLLL